MMRASFEHLRWLRLSPLHRGCGVGARIQLEVDMSPHTRSAMRYREVDRSIASRRDRRPLKRSGGSTRLQGLSDVRESMSVRLV